MLPLREGPSKSQASKDVKTAKKRAAEGEEPESESDIIVPVGEKRKRKWVKLAGMQNETIVISSDSEEGEPAPLAQVAVPATPATAGEDGREGSIGSSDSDQEDGPHLLKSHDNRRRLVRVVIWTGREVRRAVV